MVSPSSTGTFLHHQGWSTVLYDREILVSYSQKFSVRNFVPYSSNFFRTELFDKNHTELRTVSYSDATTPDFTHSTTGENVAQSTNLRTWLDRVDSWKDGNCEKRHFPVLAHKFFCEFYTNAVLVPKRLRKWIIGSVGLPFPSQGGR